MYCLGLYLLLETNDNSVSLTHSLPFQTKHTHTHTTTTTTHRDDCIPSEWDGLELPSGTRIEPKLVQTDLAKVPRLREDFDDVRQIMSLVYYSRPGNGM